MTLAAGTRLGQYEILSPLGAGGMGEVYRARDVRLDRQVAIKVLPAETMNDPTARRRFEQEARSIAALSHPNILAIHHFDAQEGVAYAVTELLEGETLREHLDRSRILPWMKAAPIAAAICDGVAAAHDKGIIHRDVKPANIFVTHDGQVKILDFGLARARPEFAVSEDASTGLKTAPGSVMGTLGYMSPEQLRGEIVETTTDIFALGCILYEMVSGKAPFARSSGAETAAAILHDEPADPVGTDVPPELLRMIRRCLEKTPSGRYHSARDLGFDLRALKSDSEGSPVTDRSAPVRRMKSIAVLPFTNLSTDPENEYFADGLTDEVTSDLSKVRALRVISRTSSMTFKGSNRDVRAIARELGVHYILEGSVRRAGNRLRITAQLIDASTDDHLWADKYDGTVEDVFAIQERLARVIVEALELRLTVDEDRRLAERPIGNLHAYECYLRARQEGWRWRKDSIDHAIQLLQNGLAIVGDNAGLYAALGLAYLQYRVAGIDFGDRPLEEAEKCARKVFALEPDSASGSRLSGWIHYSRGRIQEAVRDLKAALEIDSNNPDTLLLLSNCYLISGKVSFARPLIDVLLAVDPLTPLSRMLPGWANLLEGNLAAAVKPYREMFEMDPGNPMARLFYIWVLAINGRGDEVGTIVAGFPPEVRDTIPARVALFLAHAFAGNLREASATLSPEIEIAATATDLFPRFLAHGYARAGVPERALHWLAIAVDRGFINYPFLARHDPFFESLRSDPRFVQLMETVRERWERFEP